MNKHMITEYTRMRDDAICFDFDKEIDDIFIEDNASREKDRLMKEYEIKEQ